MQSQIGLFKLMTGDIVITRYREEGNKYIFENPYALVAGAIFPMMIADNRKDPTYEIDKVSVFLGPVKPKEKHANIYLQIVSGLTVVQGAPQNQGGFGPVTPPSRGRGGPPPTRGG